jgi:hypothetical protein
LLSADPPKIMQPKIKKERFMVNRWFIGILFAASGLSAAQAETFVIEGQQSGHEATVKIPVGAITKLSANFAQSLVNYADPQFEAMRLSGDVMISIAGSTQPIQIKADSVVLELTPDVAQDQLKVGRSEAAANKVLRSTVTLPGDDDSQVFLGNVVFDLQTSSGPMEIKADRVEHQLTAAERRPKAGA